MDKKNYNLSYIHWETKNSDRRMKNINANVIILNKFKNYEYFKREKAAIIIILPLTSNSLS